MNINIIRFENFTSTVLSPHQPTSPVGRVDKEGPELGIGSYQFVDVREVVVEDFQYCKNDVETEIIAK